MSPVSAARFRLCFPERPAGRSATERYHTVTACLFPDAFSGLMSTHCSLLSTTGTRCRGAAMSRCRRRPSRRTRRTVPADALVVGVRGQVRQLGVAVGLIAQWRQQPRRVRVQWLRPSVSVRRWKAAGPGSVESAFGSAESLSESVESPPGRTVPAISGRPVRRAGGEAVRLSGGQPGSAPSVTASSRRRPVLRARLGCRCPSCRGATGGRRPGRGV